MQHTSLLGTGLTADDLRVEALEPRLEFTGGFCNTAWGGDCSVQYDVAYSNDDFTGYVGSPCG